MSFIPEAFSHVSGAIKGGASWTKAGFKQVGNSLSYMNVDNSSAPEQTEGDADMESFHPLSILMRVLLCPVVVPLGIVYITFFAGKGSQLRIEVEEAALDPETDSDSDSESGSECESEGSPAFKTRLKNGLKRLKRFFMCKKSAEMPTSDNKLSYNNFLKNQRVKQITKKSQPPYKVCTTVARTDMVKFPYDGVFINNAFVAVDDTAQLERLLKELEEQLLQESGLDDDADVDEWERGPARVTVGESKAIVQQLLSQALKGKELLGAGKSPYPARTAAAEETKNAPEEDKTVGAPASVSTPVTAKKKIKKVHDDSAPLAERMNLEKVQAMQVSGPSIHHTPVSIVSHFTE